MSKPDSLVTIITGIIPLVEFVFHREEIIDPIKEMIPKVSGAAEFLKEIMEHEAAVNEPIMISYAAGFAFVELLEIAPLLELYCGFCKKRYDNAEASRVEVREWKYPGNAGGKRVLCPAGHEIIKKQYWIA